MKKQFVILSFFIFLQSCALKDERKVDQNTTDSVSKVELDTTWKSYQGIIPCADCPGIAMDLKIKDGFTIESYQFELKETYLEAEGGKDKTITSKGMYNFWRGNTKDPDATIIVLNDDSAESAKRYFLKVSENELKIVNSKGDEADTKLNFSLKKK